MRTAEIKAIAQERIAPILAAYMDEAPDGAVLPYAVHSLTDFSYEDARDDITLEVDIWDSYANYSRVEQYADQIEAAIVGNGEAVYSSESSVIPQFFRYLRTIVPDTDPKIKRINLKFEIQNYNL